MRPKFGARVRASDRIERWYVDTTRDGHIERWGRLGDRGHAWLKPRPVEGIYIGYRTISHGRMVSLGEGYGYAWQPDEFFECWLIVPHERANPVRVFPEDVEVL